MTNLPCNLHTLARLASSAMLDSLLAGVAIAILAWAVTRLFSRQGSGTRFAVWFSALIAIVLLPWVSHFRGDQASAAHGIVRTAVILPASFASCLFVAWIIGATLGLMRVGLSLLRLAGLRSGCSAVDVDQLDPALRASLAEIQSRRRVTLCSSSSVRVPAAIGYFRPFVVFPTWALEEIAPSELNAILLHELAHLRRWDDWTNLAQKIVKAILFFHPAVWFIEKRLSLEREMACDDAVLASNFSPRSYAESLVGLAEKSFLRSGVQLAQAAVSHVQQLKMRLGEILRQDRQGSGRVCKPAVAMMAVAGIVSVYGVSRAPRLVAFSTGSPQIASSVAEAHAGSPLQETQLRPVNLSFVEPPHQRNAIVHSTSRSRHRITHRVAQKTAVALAQRTVYSNLIEDQTAAPPIMVLSNFAMEQSTEAPSVVLLVMQGEHLGVNGPVLWRLTVVHLTQLQQRIVNGGASKKI